MFMAALAINRTTQRVRCCKAYHFLHGVTIVPRVTFRRSNTETAQGLFAAILNRTECRDLDSRQTGFQVLASPLYRESLAERHLGLD
jgi:hypothetical protein